MISLDLAGLVGALLVHVVDPLMKLLSTGAGVLAGVLDQVLGVVGGALGGL